MLRKARANLVAWSFGAMLFGLGWAMGMAGNHDARHRPVLIKPIGWPGVPTHAHDEFGNAVPIPRRRAVYSPVIERLEATP